MSERRAYLLLLAVILFWAGNFPLGKLALVVLGLTGLTGNTTTWYRGLKHTTALNAGIIGAASPIFMAVAAMFVLGDRLGGRNWLGIGLTVAAVLTTMAKGT